MVLSGISSFHGYHPIAYQRYFDFIDNFGFYDATLGKLAYQRFLKAPTGAPFPAHFKPEKSWGGETLYRRRETLSYAYFPERLERSENPLASLVQSSHSGFDPYKVSYVSVSDIAAGKNTSPSGIYAAEVVTYSDNRVKIRTDCSDDAYVIVCDYDVPGWRAYLDNAREIPIYRANYFFQMVHTPRGVHTITFTYEPFSYRLGVFCSLTAICLAIVLLVSASSPRKRKQQQPHMGSEE
jgi:hypothetical protein